MTGGSDRERREEIRIRRWAFFHLIHSFFMSVLYGGAILVIIQNAGVMALTFVPMLVALFAIGTLPRLRRAYSMFREAEAIHRRRKARLPRK